MNDLYNVSNDTKDSLAPKLKPEVVRQDDEILNKGDDEKMKYEWEDVDEPMAGLTI